jgi:ABC-type Mn2+/Zn2+ transport system ATPase subunit
LSEAAVEFESVSFAYPGADAPALEQVSLRVLAGERLGVLGPNGGGKSTLLKLALGLLKPRTGRIAIFGRSPEQARREGLIGYVPQRLDAEWALPVSVRELVTLGASWRQSAWSPVSAQTRARVGTVLELVGAAGYAQQPIGTLSGGQMQRALIARALVAGPKILALDEPTVGIDAPGQQRFAELLAKVHAELGLTILIISHDLRAIAAGSDRVACLARRLHSHTSPSGLTPQVLAEVFSHDVAGLAGALGPVHVHAHRAADCPEHAHAEPHAHDHAGPCSHTHAPAHPVPHTPLTISPTTSPSAVPPASPPPGRPGQTGGARADA